MNVLFKLLPEAVWVDDRSDKPAILAAIAERFASVYLLDRQKVLDALNEREALGSTGFGRGVALPHARIDGLTRPVAALLKLSAPVDFAAADRLPVDLVIGLLSPVNAGATHLHALAALSRMVRDEVMHRALTSATDTETLYALLTNAADRDAA
ncbi:PTS sugar transporter subunit IIA [Altererythrobacter sp. TH136]|uniref:PTS sugar transporter subunit IIA n=1 Tax=Altererythrobacter sp. TH136 TaxID=2067415 RepID=UPI001162181C|nr:PTS sugar transporter subunit IIA [Altererythrobacter sp. TH136]QDM41086.1 PTS sugar transporter subunit IIA [Altererythrobacter sp. TH136]